MQCLLCYSMSFHLLYFGYFRESKECFLLLSCNVGEKHVEDHIKRTKYSLVLVCNVFI